jgi:hypothetical protein
VNKGDNSAGSLKPKIFYRREPLLAAGYRLFNKLYFKKHLAANIPLISLHPANEKSG